MAAKLAAYVHVADEDGEMHVFGPADRVPEWAARRIVNPKAWEGGKAPYPAEPGPAPGAAKTSEVEQLRAELARVTAERDERLTLEESGKLAKMVDDLRGVEPQRPAGDGPPPKGGAGSGAPEWRAYAARNDVEVPEDANRDQVIAALTEAGVRTE